MESRIQQVVESRNPQFSDAPRVAKELHLDRGTVTKYFEMTDSQFREHVSSSQNRSKVLDEHRQDILDVYQANENRNSFSERKVSSLWTFSYILLAPLFSDTGLLFFSVRLLAFFEQKLGRLFAFFFFLIQI